MTWFVLIIWFDSAPLKDIQVNLPFPSLEACGNAIMPIEKVYLDLGITASYHCVAVGPEGDPA